MALVACPVAAADRARYQWAFDHGLVVERDGKLVPLAVAEIKLLAELEDLRRRAAGPSLAVVQA